MSNFYDDTIVASINAEMLARTGKRFNAVMGMTATIPKEVQANFPPTIIFTPNLIDAGLTMIFPKGGNNFIYLSPNLEFDSQRDVNSVVAHELAHIWLGHHQMHSSLIDKTLDHDEQPHEIAADALTASWGCPKRKRGKTRFVQIVEAIGMPK